MALKLYFLGTKFDLIFWFFLWLPTKTHGLTWIKCCPTNDQFLNAEGYCISRQGRNTSMTQNILQNSPCGAYSSFPETECESDGNSTELVYGVSGFTFSKSPAYVQLNATDSLVPCQDLRVCSEEVESSNPDRNPIFMARYCKFPKKKSVRKCCLPGHVMNAKFACVPSNNSITENDIEIFDLQERDERLSRSLQQEVQISFTGFNYLPRSVCPHHAYAVGPQIGPDYQQLHLLSTGQLYIQSKCRKKILDHFCLERQVTNTSFQLVALRCFPPQSPPQPEHEVSTNHFMVSLHFVAAIFLMVTFLTYALLAELRNLHGYVVMSHVLALAISYIGLGIIRITNLPDPFCLIAALTTHFFFLSAFTWMSIMSFDIWWTLSSGIPRRAEFSRDSERQQRLCSRGLAYSIYAWGVPLVIVITGFILDTVELPRCVIKPGFAVKSCWFKYLEHEPLSKKPELYYLYGPISITLLGNVVFFSLTASFLCQSKSSILTSANQRLIRERRVVVFNVFVLMGITWIMEIVSWVVGGSPYYWMPTDCISILRAVLIFAIFVCKRNVLSLLRQRWEPLWLPCRTFCRTRLGFYWDHKFQVPSESVSSSNPTVTITVTSTQLNNSSPELQSTP